MVLEVRLDRVLPARERMLVVLMAAVETLRELELGAVADLTDAASQREAAPRSDLGVVVVAAVEVRVVLDGADLERAEPDLLGGRGRAARDDHRVRNPFGIRHRPFERALPAHRTAHHRCPPLDPERVGEERLDRDLIADRDRREARPVRPAGLADRPTPARSCPGSRPTRSGTRRRTDSVSIARPGPINVSQYPTSTCPGSTPPAA